MNLDFQSWNIGILSIVTELVVVSSLSGASTCRLVVPVSVSRVMREYLSTEANIKIIVIRS